MRPLGLYIHIPFCQSRCGYCDFVTFTEKESHIPRYVKALTNELILYAERPRQSRTPLSTIFLGGGTPSLLNPADIQVLFGAIRKNFHRESSMRVHLFYTTKLSPLFDIKCPNA
jgi:oxygen-independent coproporphyrinogen-3 oxidase